MKKLICSTLCVMMLAGCGGGKEYTCERCGETFTGTAYTTMDPDSILCEDCAKNYWAPFSITGHEYRGD